MQPVHVIKPMEAKSRQVSTVCEEGPSHTSKQAPEVSVRLATSYLSGHIELLLEHRHGLGNDFVTLSATEETQDGSLPVL